MRPQHPMRDDIVRLRADGVGPREIARRLEISPNVVAGVLHRADLNTEPRGRGYAAPDEVRASAVAVAAERGMSAAIAASGKTWSTVAGWCESAGVKPARPVGAVSPETGKQMTGFALVPRERLSEMGRDAQNRRWARYRAAKAEAGA